ncbi:MAG: glucosamine-6-phosphate deaminase [Verrucomicrobia bacterium]|nr:glucosamine-6-phosphate deaminase [Verrucomicrobiota bacterium]
MKTAAAPARTFTVDALDVRVYASQPDLATDAARLVGDRLREALARQPRAAAILASATSQVQFLAALVRQPNLDWSRLTLFHMDEYLGITADHRASFRRFLREHVEAHVRPQRFHYLAGDAAEPLTECDRYTRLLTAQPIEICCLGIGENGHLAFNDPPVADFADPRTVKLVQLDEACRRQQVGEGCFPTLAAVPQYAYSLTIPALCSARRMFCIVPEQRKAQAVRDTLYGPVATACPASILRRQAHCTLFLDCDSAGLAPGAPAP